MGVGILCGYAAVVWGNMGMSRVNAQQDGDDNSLRKGAEG